MRCAMRWTRAWPSAASDSRRTAWQLLLRHAQALQKTRRLEIIRERVVEKFSGARIFGARELFFIQVHQLALYRLAVHRKVGVPVGRELLIGAVDDASVVGVGEFADRLFRYRGILPS